MTTVGRGEIGTTATIAEAVVAGETAAVMEGAEMMGAVVAGNDNAKVRTILQCQNFYKFLHPIFSQFSFPIGPIIYNKQWRF